MLNFIDNYKINLNKKKFIYDEKQELVVNELNSLCNILLLKNKRKESIFFSDIFNFFKKDELLGLYIWGGVGRGKTYLMDLFFFYLSIDRKVRFHFHHFMKLIHSKLKEHSGKKDPLKIIAKWLSKRYIIICLDEFFVTDIGDAMTLSKLFSYIFECNIFLVITSNIIPKKLYKGGLQRQKFLSAIYLIEKYLKIINIDGEIDYRLINLEKEDIFLLPLNFTTFKSFKRLFFNLSKFPPKRKVLIEIFGRKILALYISGSNVWFDFNIICGRGRSQLDYIEIASSFTMVFLSGVKRMSSKNDDKAKRFILLIDEFYDKKINLIMSLECNINDLYSGEILKFDFKRTVSRLNEMLTKKYLESFN